MPQTLKTVHYLSGAKALYNQTCTCAITLGIICMVLKALYMCYHAAHNRVAPCLMFGTLNQSQMQGLEAESVQLQLSMLQVLYSTLTMCKGCRPRPPKDVPKTQAYQLGDSNGWSHAELHPYPDM